MNIVKKGVLSLGVSTTVSLIALLLVARVIVLGGFRELEQSLSAHDVERLGEQINSTGTGLLRILTDYAVWDDTYEFVLRPTNQAYIKANYVPAVMGNVKVEYAAIFNSKGKPLIRYANDLEEAEDKPWPKDLDLLFTPESELLRQTSTETQKNVIHMLEGRPYWLSAGPILPSEGDKPSRGAMIMMRPIDDKARQELEKNMGVKLELLLDQKSLSPRCQRATTAIPTCVNDITVVDANTIQGTLLVFDHQGKPAFSVRLTTSRDVFQAGLSTLKLFSYATTVLLLALLALTILFLRKTILTRLERLSSSVAHITQTNDLSHKTLVEGRDEISALASSFNVMLDRISTAQEEIERSHAINAQMNKQAAIGEMAGGVAHELNNPLTILKLKSTMADKLLSTENPNLEEARKCLTSIKDTSSRVATVVDALRLLGRNTDDDKVAPTTLPSLVGSALAICEGNIRLRSINLQVTHADETATVECKPAQIGQVILGLLSNAIDAVAPAPDKWIQIETRALESQIEIAITDSGGGIPPEVREKIMKPFFSTKSKDKAIGLGLSFAREMVQKHRGEFFLDPEATRTRFVIRLPKVST